MGGYFGDNNAIVGGYIGATPIERLYLGTEIIFESAPWEGLTLSPRTFNFDNEGASAATATITASEAWTATTPAWITATPSTGDSGTTQVLLEADATMSASTSGYVEAVSYNFSSSAVANYTYVAPPVVNFVDAVRSENAPMWTLNEYIDTGLYVTGDTTIRIKYIGAGVFSDRIVGFDAIECGNDDMDFRYFPTMSDAGEVRLSTPSSLYDDGIAQDITFGNIYVFDNINEYMVAEDIPRGTISPNTTIRIDMSVNWIQQVTIETDGNVVFDGVAAQLGGEYGLWDNVTSTLFTSSNCTIIGNER